MTQSSETQGNIPSIVKNSEGLYQGNLTGYFRAVFFNAQNLRNPYHNFRHMCHVLFLCYQACLFYKDKFSEREMRTLLVAALFHDFNHTGGTGPDSVNIARAIAGLERHLEMEDGGEYANIVALMKATEFPYKVPTESLGLRAQIIRDADMAQSLGVAWIQQTVFGLASEWGKEPFNMLKDEVGFHKNLKFHTEWAKKKFPPAMVSAKLAEVTELIEILSV